MEHFFIHLAAAGRSKGTLALRKSHLQRFERFIGHDLETATVEELESFLAGDFKAEYKRSVRSTFRQFYTWLQATGRRTDNPAHSLLPIAPSQPRPRPTPTPALERALQGADEDETLMIRLGVEAGMRRGEVAVVHELDLFEDLGGWSLVVHGKGSRERVAPLNDGLARTLLVRFRKQPGWLFPGHVDGHISAAWIGKRVSRLLPDGVTMHSLRHRFATRAYIASDRDLLVVQQLLGHSSPTVTQRYVQVEDMRLRAVSVAAAA